MIQWFQIFFLLPHSLPAQNKCRFQRVKWIWHKSSLSSLRTPLLDDQYVCSSWTEEPGGLQSVASHSRTRPKRLSTHPCLFMTCLYICSRNLGHIQFSISDARYAWLAVPNILFISLYFPEYHACF